MQEFYKIRQNAFTPEQIKEIRSLYGLSQKNFAILLGICVDTFRNWEKGKRSPCSSGASLLKIADEKPESFLKRKKISAAAKQIINICFPNGNIADNSIIKKPLLEIGNHDLVKF